VSGRGIGWAICKSTPRSKQITTPAPHHSVFYRPDALPAAQPTASKHWRDSRHTYTEETVLHKLTRDVYNFSRSLVYQTYAAQAIEPRWSRHIQKSRNYHQFQRFCRKENAVLYDMILHCVPEKVSPLNILQQPPQTYTDLNEILHTQDDIYFCHRRQIS